MQQYLDLVKYVLENGDQREDRTKVSTLSVFGSQMRFNLKNSFPLMTTKRLWWKAIVHELLWFLSGDTNIKYLKDNGVDNIWKHWADKDGNLGPIYGKQWRHWKGITEAGTPNEIDQIKVLIEGLKKSPYSRRHMVNTWNVSQLDEMALPPCHTLFQFHVAKNKLSCQLYQRSVDVFLGLPFNIACYSLLTHMVAQVCDLEVGEFIHTGGDVHIYLNHIDACNELLTREPKELPTLKLNKNIKNIDSFTEADIFLENYTPHPSIKAPVAI